MINWLRNMRLDKLRIDLAEVEAEIASDADIARRTGTVYPVAAAVQAKRRARIKEKMRQIQERMPKENPAPAG